MLQLIYSKPVTSSLRHYCFIDKSFTNVTRSLNYLLKHKNVYAGKNNTGRTMIFHRKSKSHKSIYRIIDFKRNVALDIPLKVMQIEYDPNRSSFIALLLSKNGIYSYVLLAKNMNLNDVILNYRKFPEFFSVGNASMLLNIPLGTLIHNIEALPGFGGTITRSAGTYSVLLKRDSSRTCIKLSSGKILFLSNFCTATIGTVSNSFHKFSILGKAGRASWLGHKSHVRGVAMNPVDHPHGGSKGKKSPRVCPFSLFFKRDKWRKTARFSN